MKKIICFNYKKVIFKTVKVLIITFIFLINNYFFDINNAYAHRPHDVVTQVKLSSNYEKDQTLFIITRRNLFKSIDGGKSWQRIVNGLNNRGIFQELSRSNNNDQVIYLSSYVDGVYKTEDGGISWFKVNNGLDNLNVTKLKVTPNNDKLVLVADDKNNVYKTENGGNNWQKIFTTKGLISTIFITQNASEIKFIIGDIEGNLYISENQGKNWQTLNFLNSQNSGSINAIAINNSDLNNFWIGTEKKGVFETKNNGESFTEISNGLTDLNITDLLIDSGNKLYISTYNEGFFSSNDNGKTWLKQSDGLTKDPQADDLKQPHFNVLAQSGETLFLGGFNGLFKSINLGKNWQELETLSLGTVVALDVSPNYANDQTLAIVTYVGNFYLSKDGGKTWNHYNKGLEIPRLISSKDDEGEHQHPRRFFDVIFSPNYAQDNTIFSSLLWSKIAKLTNQKESWQVIQLPKEVRGPKIVISANFNSDQTIYVTSQQGVIFKSTNGGANFSTINKIEKIFGNDPPSLVISPNFSTDKTLYIATQKGIYKTIDGGENWATVTFQTPLENQHNFQLAISPNYAQDQTVIVGTSEGLFKTENGGQKWTNLPIPEIKEIPYIECLAISPNYQNDQTILVSIRGEGLYKSTDAGQTFKSIGDRTLPHSRMNEVPSAGNPLKFSPAYATDNTIYSFGSATTAVFKSTDGGNTWEVLPVPINPVSEIENYDLMTSLDIWFYLNKGNFFRILGAIFIGLLTYFLVGFLRLEKKIPLSKIQIKTISSFTIFLVTLLVFYKL